MYTKYISYPTAYYIYNINIKISYFSVILKLFKKYKVKNDFPVTLKKHDVKNY